MPENIVDGTRFVPVDECGEIQIVVLERGFIYVGRFADSGKAIVIRGARSLIRWGTDQHLGQLFAGPLPKTKLGASCTVRARGSQVIHTMEVDQDAWAHHIS